MLYGFANDRVPGINEPHYLTKAKHYWNPQWCADDFFLESANPHLVFYHTVGSLTRVFSFEQTAWIGRSLAYLLLAVGWTSLVCRLSAIHWTSVWSVWLFLAISTVGNFSGEWLVGGVESKVISYALVFCGLAFLLGTKPRRAAACFGASISFHPVVGVWSSLAAVMAVLAKQIIDRKSRPTTTPQSAGASRLLKKVSDPLEGVKDKPQVGRPERVRHLFQQPASRFREPILCAIIGLLCSLPGLIPAVGLLGASAAEIQSEANYIQVFYRLKHHLDPSGFGIFSYVFYLVLTVVWFCVHRFGTPSESQRLFFWFVVAATVIAFAGFVVGFHDGDPSEMPFYQMRMKLMKFYPFRLFDVLLPIAVAVCVSGLVNGRVTNGREEKRSRIRAIGWLIFGSAFVACVLYLALRDPSPDNKLRRDRDWIAACQWIEQNTPRDALFLTPTNNKNFKWYAQRAEYVSWKDCPQDALGIVEWNRRLRYLKQWAKTKFDHGYSQAAVLDLSATTAITHIITKRLGSFEQEPIFRNDSYRVYRVRR